MLQRALQVCHGRKRICRGALDPTGRQCCGGLCRGAQRTSTMKCHEERRSEHVTRSGSLPTDYCANRCLELPTRAENSHGLVTLGEYANGHASQVAKPTLGIKSDVLIAEYENIDCLEKLGRIGPRLPMDLSVNPNFTYQALTCETGQVCWRYMRQ